MKILLAGSPEISIPAFEKVINNFDVVGIITQPDKPKGRGMKLQETPVARLGEKYGIKVFKPEKISTIKGELMNLNFDILLTFAYGQYVPTTILKLGNYKPINIHGSLLPKYRGAAPIHHAILNGDKKIGISLIEMIKEMDAGDIFFKAHKSIDETTTTGEGFNIVSSLAEEHIVDWLNQIKKSTVIPEKQSDEFTVSPKIKKTFGEINLSLTVNEALRKILGLSPFPGAFILMNNKRLKIFNASTKEVTGSIILKFSDGDLNIFDYQWEGKKRFKIY